MLHFLSSHRLKKRLPIENNMKNYNLISLINILNPEATEAAVV